MPESTTPGQRFLQLIQQLGLTKNAFAQSLGKTATVIQHIVDERNKPGYDLLNRVCEVYPNVSGEWLLRGLGPMMRERAAPAPAVAAPPEATPAANGIDLREVPNASRRRSGNLLQPADIAATLALATPAVNGNGHSHAALAVAAEPAPLFATATATIPDSAPVVPPVPAEVVPATAPLPSVAPVAPVAATATPTGAVAPTAPPAPASFLPDPAYLAAALQTQHLQHQLALAEQRNQHLLEQQALLRQMMELLQKV